MHTTLLTVLALSSALAACTSIDSTTEEDISAATTSEVKIFFKGDWTTEVQGTLVQGKLLRLNYAQQRVKCGGTTNGGAAAWTVTAFYRWNGGVVENTFVAGHNPSNTAAQGILLDRKGRLEIWFQNTNRFGCNAWDSDYGNNYVFEIGSEAPGWIGNAQFAIDRATCNGTVCPGSWRPLEGGFNYETWARQRAALRVVGFEVWKAAVTDFDNPNLWQQLDAQVRYRFVGEESFRSAYVSFDQRWGNNAHYLMDLRSFDPFAWPAGANIRTRADCPSYQLRKDASGQLVQADFEFYFVVNGSELRAANGQVFRGAFQDYLGNYAVCLQ